MEERRREQSAYAGTCYSNVGKQCDDMKNSLRAVWCRKQGSPNLTAVHQRQGQAGRIRQAVVGEC